MLHILQLSKKNILFIILLICIEIIFFIIIKHITKKPTILSNQLHTHETHTHYSHTITINIYNTKIKQQYRFKLTAQYIQYTPNKKIAQLIQPYMIVFNTKNVAIWKITSNHAILNYKTKIVNLKGYVYIDYLSENVHFLSILTNQMTMNLLTNNINSNKKVILHGHHFYSIGSQMQGNLHTRTIQLINNAHTYYEV